MIPLFVLLDIRSRFHRPLRLWLPLFLVWLVLLPFALVLLPVAAIALSARNIDPRAAIGAFFAVLCGARGAHVEIESPDNSVFIHVC